MALTAIVLPGSIVTVGNAIGVELKIADPLAVPLV